MEKCKNILPSCLVLYDLMRAACRDVHLGMDNTIKLHNSQRNINMRREQIAWGTRQRTEDCGQRTADRGQRQQDTLSWAACALLTFHYPVKYSKVRAKAKAKATASRHRHSRDTEAGKATRTGTCLSLGALPLGPAALHQLIIYAKRVLFGF